MNEIDRVRATDLKNRFTDAVREHDDVIRTARLRLRNAAYRLWQEAQQAGLLQGELGPWDEGYRWETCEEEEKIDENHGN